jgi:limonene 1,2-monooxygenase
LGHIIPLPTMQATTLDSIIDEFNASGTGIIGTPAMAIECIERLDSQSGGGFGSYLMMGGEIANRGATLESYQLFAEEVMPHFQGQLEPLQKSHDWVRNAADDGGTTRWVAQTTAAIKQATEDYKSERAQTTS